MPALKRLHRNDNAQVGVTWKKQYTSSSLVRLTLRGSDRLGIIYDITQTISLTLCVNIHSFFLVTHDNIFDASLEIYVQNPVDMNKLIEQLKMIKGMETVTKA